MHLGETSSRICVLIYLDFEQRGMEIPSAYSVSARYLNVLSHKGAVYLVVFFYLMDFRQDLKIILGHVNIFYLLIPQTA